MRTISRNVRVVGLGLLCGVVASAALAGPPLLCHPVKCDASQTLPAGKDAFSRPGSCSASDVVSKTTALLNPEAPVLARMETIRRATLYIEKNTDLADDLMGRLMARIIDADAAGKPDALAWFDAGYLAACLRQAGVQTHFGPTAGKSGASAIAGYSWVVRAIKLSGGNGQMELAAALMTVDHRVPEHEQHIRNALASASSDPATEDLLQWIAQINGTTLESLRGKLGVADAR